MIEDWQHAGFGLYLHWPFCQSKCPYCDFNSHVAQGIDQSAWAAAFEAEIDRVGALTDGRVVNTIFFGGGTPSLMEAPLVQRILDRVRATWSLANDVEITLEANPGSVEAARFDGYAKAGVNRVSLGIQSLDPDDLRRLGRMHSVDEALSAISIAKAAFSRVSIDLIYARQNQTLAAWRDELLRALDLGTSHLSLYQLTIEDGTVFGEMQRRNRLPGLPQEELAVDMYSLTQELTQAAGRPGYEVSNHASPGDESRHNLIYWRMGDYAGIGPGAHGRLTLNGTRFATEAERAPTLWLDRTRQSAGAAERTETLAPEDRADEYRHNLIYWRMGDYAGIGPGAHGRLTLNGTRFATEAERMPTLWLDRTRQSPGAAERSEVLAAEDRADEYLMFALRLREGASLDRFTALAGAPLAEDALAEMTSLGFLYREGDRISTTAAGVLMLNGVLRALLADRQTAG